ncbi:type II secretion system protein GspE [Rhodothalassium salexigens]|uniref:type II secretion system ATPase GspE n=1 Tax=Rhodothalassium salexigens TaxID=1086 RepID=UPI0019135977|nr:type II secretion system ATPase GspE [Rhodothalassium salexigens]MBK5920933.1 type II secretion system protein GspE [Rhodothalassium salexigens]
MTTARQSAPTIASTVDKPNPVLGYPFAKEHGVVLLDPPASGSEWGAGPVRVGLRQGARHRPLIEVRRALGRPLAVETLAPGEFDRRLSELYALDGFDADGFGADDEAGAGDDLSSLLEDMPRTADLLDADDDAPIIRLINGVIGEAVRQNASDIHVEPFEGHLAIRLRVDGVLQEVADLGARLAPVIVSRIKVMARMDIAEKRVPQDGRISLALGGRSLDVRVSTLPSRHGERVVLRLLDKDQAHFHMDQLGMPAAILAAFERGLAEPNGIILVTGPTGSGKTTTLYAGLAGLNDASRNILTVEDPVEYALDGVGQTQVQPKVGMTFAAGLRAILRQDPDVVMVGEIRDLETVQIAVQASLTGHLVLSTVHTNSAVAAITRLRDMGVEPFLLASTVKVILAQRLVRRLCPACRRPHAPTPGEAQLFAGWTEVPGALYRPVGCEACNRTGFAGRVGLYELVEVDETLRAMIHDDAREQALAEHAFRDADTLLRSGLRHVAAGTTSLEEVMRVTRRDRAAGGAVLGDTDGSAGDGGV